MSNLRPKTVRNARLDRVGTFVRMENAVGGNLAIVEVDGREIGWDVADVPALADYARDYAETLRIRAAYEARGGR